MTATRLPLPALAISLALVALPAPAGAQPSTPSGVAASAISCNEIVVSWQASQPSGAAIFAYRIQRSGTLVAWVLASSTQFADRKLAPATTYAYTVAAVDYAGRMSPLSAPASARTPACLAAAPPSTPPNVFAYATSCTEITVSWTASVPGEHPLQGYRVFQDGVFLKQVLASATSTTHAGLASGSSGSYAVSAVDTAGTESPRSASVTATTPQCPDLAPPSVPAGIRAEAVGCAAVDLTWNAATDTGGSKLKGYNVQRDGRFLKYVAAPATSLSDTGLAASTAYSYRVSALDNAGNQSGLSALATATTPRCTTEPPIANAGPDRITQTLTPVALSGAGSVDPDGRIVAWSWSLGDGDTASGESVSHTYDRPGTYTVTLKVTDDTGLTATDTAVVTASNRAPVADAGPDVQAVAGATLTFNAGGSRDPDGTIVAYGWDFGDGQSATGVSVQHAYQASGTYIATLTVRDDKGATATDRATVTITEGGGGGGAGGGGGSTWARAFGGSGSDVGQAVAVDGSGNVLLGGRFTGAVKFGGTTLSGSGSTAAVLAKYTAAGAHAWSRGFGGDSSTVIGAVAADGRGDVVVAGWFMGTANLGAGAVTSAGGLDGFVAKYAAADGRHLWSRTFGETRTDAGYAVAVDSRGDVFVTGAFQRDVDFGGGVLTSRFAGLDVFVAKYAGADGRHVWSTSFWNYGDDIAYGAAVDGNGDVIIGGFFGSRIDFGTGQMVGPAANNGFVTKLRGSDGKATWARALASSGNSRVYGLAVESGGDVLATGFFEGTADLGTGPLVAQGISDTFVARYAGSNGAHVWSRSFPNDGTDTGYGIALAGGTAAITGHFRGSINFGDGALASAGRSDVFVAALAVSNGSTRWSDAFGGPGNDYGYGVVIDGGGRVIATGYFTEKADFAVEAFTSAGSADVFLLSVAP
jgi:PKD repeat protein